MEVANPTTPVSAKPSVDEMLLMATRLINKRKNGWTMTTLEFDDVRQKLLIHLWQKYHLFDPKKGPLQNWINRVISYQKINYLRDILFKHSSPCIGSGGCVFNQGGNACGYTASGTKCAECPLYAKWQEKKEFQHNIKAPLPLDNHSQEVNNMPGDFTDYEGAKKRIDEVMLTQLTPFERRVYRMLIIQHLTPSQACEKLKRVMKKRKLKEGEGIGYQSLLRMLKTFKSMIILVIRQEGLG